MTWTYTLTWVMIRSGAVTHWVWRDAIPPLGPHAQELWLIRRLLWALCEMRVQDLRI